MPNDLIYDKSEGTLTGLGGTWNVRSGGTTRNHAALANGIYTAPAGSLMTGTGTNRRAGVPSDRNYDRNSFSDRRNFHWFFWLGRGGLGIHPDGNVPGTEGCIGVTDDDTRDLFEALRAVRHRTVTVEVRD